MAFDHGARYGAPARIAGQVMSDRSEGAGRPAAPAAAGRASRRRMLLAGVAAGAALPAGAARAQSMPRAAEAGRGEAGTEYFATKQVGDRSIRLALWRKPPRGTAAPAGRPPVLFVHGSSTAGRATFDLQVPGQPDYSVMDWFARRGHDTWCLDHEGYGRSDKSRPTNADVATGADDLEAATAFIARETGAARVMMYGISSGSLRAGLFVQRHPDRVARLPSR